MPRDTDTDIPGGLHRHERQRLPRASRLQALSTANKTRFHLPNGPEQQREVQMATDVTDWSFDTVAWIYENDAAAVGPTST